MASTEFLLLSSSPPKQFLVRDVSSSPPLPSLADMLKRKPGTLPSGSRAAPIPENATATFTSAAALLKAPSVLPSVDMNRTFMLETEEDHKSLEENTKPAKQKPRKTVVKKTRDDNDKVAKAPRKTTPKAKDDELGSTEAGKSKKARKPRTRKAVDDLEGDGDGVEKVAVPRKSRAKKSDKEAGGDVVKEKPARKPRAKKTEDGTQSKLVKGKVTKTTSKPDRKSKAVGAAIAALDPFTDPAGFGLEDAVRRRANWTPPPLASKATETTPLNTEAHDGWLASGGFAASIDGKKGFMDLLGNFGFTKTVDSAFETKSQAAEVTRKRKLVELVKTNASAAGVVSPTKEKAPKKKARTITDQATSAYLDHEEEDRLPSKTAPLLQYFALQTTDKPVNDGFNAPRKSRSKSPIKAKDKKGTAQAPILLSPVSALKQAGNQDYVFGTSSQLAREDSPTLLRDLHEAMQASNEADHYNEPITTQLLSSESLAKTSSKALATKRNLWSAAARDSTGELMEVEMLDLAHSSPAIARVSQSKVLAAIRLSTLIEEGWHDVEAVGQSFPAKPELESPRKPGPVEVAIRTELPHSPPRTQTKIQRDKFYVARDPKPANAQRPASQPSSTLSATKLPKMPDFSAYPTARLEKDIASYRFKPVKGRSQMIALLERCWESKNRAALKALETNVSVVAPAASKPPPPSQIATTSPKRPRGRPRKDASTTISPKAKRLPQIKTTHTIECLEMDSDTPLSQRRTPKQPSKKNNEILEEIEDSDDPPTPSPPRRPLSQAKTELLPLELFPAEDAGLLPDELQKLLFTHISRAVKSVPSSKDSTTPSWHEKILLYDPIILEDLAVWLNTGALEKVGWDGEVDPKEVKKWCESKSICCLWKENLRGGARSRY